MSSLDSIISVTVPAETHDLVDIEDAAEELGLTLDGTTASKLQRLITATSQRFASLCGRQFVVETVSEAFRSVCAEKLILARRPILSPITSIVADGVTLTVGTDYESDNDAGIVYRLSGGCRTWWSAQALTVVYRAGYLPIPADVSDAVLTVLRTRWLVSQSVSGGSSILKSFSIEGIGREDYWVPSSGSSSSDNGLPPDFQPVADTIQMYREMLV